MKRRGFLLASCIPMVAFSQTQTQSVLDQMRPYLQVNPVPGEEAIVRAYFTPSCPYSMQYLQFFKNLAATLPGNKVFEFTYAVNKIDGVEFALAFAAVQKFYPAFTQNFVEASLIGSQERGISAKAWAGIDRIARAAGIKRSIPRLVGENREVLEKMVLKWIGIQKALQITNTPAVSVNGTYIVTPEFSSGDMAVFSQLVNGVISMSK